MFDEKRNREPQKSSTENKPISHSISRREFFKGFMRNIAETAEKLIDSDPNAENTGWIKLGRISEFQPGSVTAVNSGAQLLYSTGRGFQAVDNGNEIKIYRPLKLDEHGLLSLDPSGAWPDNGYLSLMTSKYKTDLEIEI